MQDKNRVNKVIIKKIIDYCENIEMLIERFGNNFESYNSDFAFQLSCGMCIIQIGELTTRLSEDFKENFSEIAWNKIKAFRNIQAHDYENIKLEKSWKILQTDIPDLKEKLQKILSEMN